MIENVAKLLQVKVEYSRSDRKNPQYRIRTNSLKTNQIIRNYLVEYPLQGSKYLDYLDWCKVLSYFELGTHKENKAHIVEIKSQMNQRRTVFNWDHL
jgi:hypothetical protein